MALFAKSLFGRQWYGLPIAYGLARGPPSGDRVVLSLSLPYRLRSTRSILSASEPLFGVDTDVFIALGRFLRVILSVPTPSDVSRFPRAPRLVAYNLVVLYRSRERMWTSESLLELSPPWWLV